MLPLNIVTVSTGLWVAVIFKVEVPFFMAVNCQVSEPKSPTGEFAGG